MCRRFLAWLSCAANRVRRATYHYMKEKCQLYYRARHLRY